MKPTPSLLRHPEALIYPTRAAIRIRNGGNWSNAAAKAGEASAAAAQPLEPRPPPSSPPPFFSDLGLDRCSAARKDAALLAELSSREGATAIVVRGGDALMMEKRSDGESGESGGGGSDPDAPASPDLFLARLPLAEARRLLELSGSGDHPILLGVGGGGGGGAPLFAVALPRGAGGDAAAAGALEEAARAAAAARESSGSSSPLSFAFVPVRSEGPRMPPRDAAAAALAVGLSSFHSRARFDPASGLGTRMASAGHARDEVVAAPEAAAEEVGERRGRGKRPGRSRPRVDPAVLVLASCSGHVLLGRKRSWPARRYSLLAGFAELGETLEQAAERELAEEAGVVAAAAAGSPPPSSPSLGPSSSRPPSSRYLGSQPWPFPSSLMVAMRVDVDPIADDDEEEGEGEGEEDEEDDEKEEGGKGKGAATLSRREISLALWPSRALPAAAPLDGELEDVRWFPAEAVLEACEKPAAGCGLRLPGRHALARSVLSSWASSEASSPSSSSSSSSSSSPSSSAFFASLFSSEEFPCVPRSLPESSSSGSGMEGEGEEEEEAGGLYELFRVRRRREDGGAGGGGGGGETALALRWLVPAPSPRSSSPPSSTEEGDEVVEGDRERLARAAEREASAAGLSVEAVGRGEIAFGRRRRRGRGEEEEERGEAAAAAGGSVPLEERRVVLRSGGGGGSKGSSSAVLREVCACLVRRAHPLAEVAVE